MMSRIEIANSGVQTQMKVFLGSVVLTLGFVMTTVAADAKGCIKGAVVGGIAGHAAHHGLVGAAAGCVIGHHEANKKETAPQNPPLGQSPAPGQNK
jgi:hypothetical protein